MAEHSQYYKRFEINKNLSDIIDNVNIIIVKNLENLTLNLSIRKKCYLFYCLLNITLYNLENNNIMQAKLLLKFIDKKIDELKEQKNIDLYVVKMMYFTIIFQMQTKYQQKSKHYSAIIFGEFILNEATSIKYTTSDDTIRIPLLLFNIINDITNYCLARYDVAELESYLLMLFKFTYKLGLIFRAIEILLLLALIYLYREQSDDSQVENNFFF